MKTVTTLFFMLAASILVSCSGSSTATTRKEKEVEFKNAFGFAPPSTIVSIEYSDLYNRGVMDGAYAQWMGFTYDEEVYRKILDSGYTSSARFTTGEASPAWWPKEVVTGSEVFSRGHHDTPAGEGFSFREHLWHDKSTGKVYFHKSYWD